MVHEFKNSDNVYEWRDEFVCKKCGYTISFAAEECMTLEILNQEYTKPYWLDEAKTCVS